MHPDRPAVEPAVVTALHRMIQRAPGRVSRRAAALAFLAERRPAELCQRCVPVPLLTGLLAEAFAAAPTDDGADRSADSVTGLLAA